MQLAELRSGLVSAIKSRVGLLKTKLADLQITKKTSAIADLHSGGLNEKCGVFAYFSLDGNKRIGEILSKSMQRLVHRGDKAAGAAYY